LDHLLILPVLVAMVVQTVVLVEAELLAAEVPALTMLEYSHLGLQYEEQAVPLFMVLREIMVLLDLVALEEVAVDLQRPHFNLLGLQRLQVHQY
jgi:hypothetical protein